MRGHFDLPWMRARGMDAFIESDGRAAQCFQSHRARLHFRKRRPNAARMTAHEIKLQLAQLRRSDGEVREFAEARVDAVNDAPRLRNLFNDAPRLRDPLTRFI